MKPYKEEYDKFITDYKSGDTDAEQTGILIARLAQYFAETNMLLSSKEKRLNNKAVEISGGKDDNLKPISVAKSEILTKATDEWNEYNEVRIDLNNIETMINALKSLQRAIGNEYSHMSKT